MMNKIRSAFTLIELMIALGLLGALMAVAWSMLGTFRDAEIRGWKLSHRTQTIRSARAWLEDDIQHLAVPESPVVSNASGSSKSSNSMRFLGNAMGFSATIAPSIDPIPFLQNLMSDTVQPEGERSLGVSPLGESLSGEPPLGEESSMTATPSSPWPAETIEIEYHLAPVPSNSISVSGSLTGNSDQTQFVLTRREMIDTNTISVVSSQSERLLTAQDLYRQTDEEILSSSQPIRESRLEGLMKAQFRYYDGSSWKSEWNSTQQDGLPRGIAFGFDFPAVSDMRPASETTAQPSDQVGSSTENVLANNLPFAESASSTEATAEVSRTTDQGLMESSTNEVQIVIYVGKGNSKSKGTSKQPMQRDLP